MAKRATTSTGSTRTVKRAKKTAPRSSTVRRAAKPVETPATGPTETAAHREPTSEQIAERAYFLSLERKGPGGPLDDWLQAERELRNRSIPV